MQMDEERYDIVIAGGGAVGLTLACALADALGPAIRIAVVDRAPFAWRGRATRYASLGRVGRLAAPAGGAGHLAVARRPCRSGDGGRHHRCVARRRVPSHPRLLRQHGRRRRARHLYRRERTPDGGHPRGAVQRLVHRPDGRRRCRGLCRRRAWRRGDACRRPPLARAAAGGSRRARVAPARGGRHRRRRLEVSAGRHRHHGPSREAAPLACDAAFPAVGPVCDPAAARAIAPASRGRRRRARAGPSWRSTMPAFSRRSRSASAIAWAASSWPGRAPYGRWKCIWRARWWRTAWRWSAMPRTWCIRSPGRG